MSGSLTQSARAAIDQDFARAIESHQKGKLDRARRGYKRVLKDAPNHADAIHLLGVVDLQRDNPARAKNFIQKALTINPDIGPAHYNLARCHKALDELDECIESVERALEFMPADVDALILYANALVELERKEEAIDVFSKILEINPDMDTVRNARSMLRLDLEDTETAYEELEQSAARSKSPHKVWRDMAVHRVQQEDKEGAIPLLYKALELAPDDWQTRSLTAGLLIDTDRLNEALPLTKGMLAERPNDVEVLLKMGILLNSMKQYRKSIPLLESVLAIQPNEDRALLKLAFAHQQLEEFDKSIELYERLKVMLPNEARSWSNLSAVYLEMEDFEQALDEGMEALRVNPNVEQSYLNIAVILQKLGDYDRAIDLYQRALEVNPDYHTAGSNLAHLLLSRGDVEKGDIENGWDLYGHGFNAGLRRPLRHPNVELWRGQDIPEDSILVWKEQGVGDDLRFASCFQDIIDRAGHVYLETDPRLVDLYQRSFPAATVRAERTKTELDRIGPPEFRYHTPAGQLAVYYRRSLDAFPGIDGWLTPDPERVAFWRKRVEAAGDGIRVGLSWRSMHRSASRNLVYSELDDWAELIATPGLTCINLQYDNADEEIAAFHEKTGLTLHSFEDIDLKDDLDDAAALTKACDLVVSAGTSVADMAAAVGTPVLFYADIRHAMQLGTDHFPWYPSARFYGRERKQPMTELVAQITADVQGFATQYRSGELG